MLSARDVDAFLLLTLATAAKRRPATLAEVMAAADLSHGAIPYRDELGDAFHQLATHGLIRAADDCYTLTQEGEVIIAKQPRKAGNPALIASIRDSLLAHRGKDKHPPILISEEQLVDAIAAHRTSGQGTGQNLLMPKSRPPETRYQRAIMRGKPTSARGRKT